jgi:hypothetical protein
MLDPDVERALVTELDALVDRYGEEAPAEELLRFD